MHGNLLSSLLSAVYSTALINEFKETNPNVNSRLKTAMGMSITKGLMSRAISLCKFASQILGYSPSIAVTLAWLIYKIIIVHLHF